MASPNLPPPKPFIVPVFLPYAGCPHRCAFCNQHTISGQAQLPAPDAIEAHIRQFLAYRQEKRQPAQIAYYGGNFLGLPSEAWQALLRLATRFVQKGEVASIRFSTRPDTILPERLEMLKGFPVTTIELGAQSMDDQVLQAAHRGHTAGDTAKAVERLQSAGFEIGLQLMLGLPGDTASKALASGRNAAALKPDFVRIYPTLVLAGSLLARWYEQGRYTPLRLEEAVALAAHLYRLFQRCEIPVIRMGLQAARSLDEGKHLLAGPYHPSFGHLVYSKLFLDKALETLKGLPREALRTATISVHSRNISKMQGLRNGNVTALKRRFGITTLKIVPDDALADDAVRVTF
jgi:histone acetyltransferase (RNA polymerase elongator complex component)